MLRCLMALHIAKHMGMLNQRNVHGAPRLRISVILAGGVVPVLESQPCITVPTSPTPPLDMPGAVQVVGGLFVALSFIFAGLLIPGPSIPVWWKWVYYCNPASYAVEALTSPQFHCDTGANCPTLTLVDGGSVRTIVISQYITTYFGFEYGDRWIDVGWLTLFAGALALLGVASASCISWVKR